MTISKYLMLAALVAAGINAKAQTIDELVQQIVSNNPELAGRSMVIAADKYEASDANALSNPEVGMTRVWGKDGIGNKLQFNVSQTFDWPGAYRGRSRANAMGEAAARQQLLAERLATAQTAKMSLIELVYLRKQRQVLSGLIENMQQLNAAVTASLERGHVTILDEKKTKLETYKYHNQLAALDAREREVVAGLQSMAGGMELSLGDVQEYPLERLLSMAEYQDMAMQADPALAAGQMTARQSELEAKASVLSRFPSFTVGYEFQNELGDHFNGFTLGMTLPFFENRHGKAAYKLRQSAAEKAVEQTIADNIAEVDAKYSALSIWKEQMEQYRSLFGDNTYLSLLKKSYDGGEINVINYINESSYYRENAMDYLEIEYNYYIALSDLNKYEMVEKINN